MAKKDEKFIEFIELFDAKNDQLKKAKINNHTFTTSERSVTSY